MQNRDTANSQATGSLKYCRECGIPGDDTYIMRCMVIETGTGAFGVWACKNCGYVVFGEPGSEGEPGRVVGMSRFRTKAGTDVPLDVQADADEAFRCYSVGSDNAALVMARRSLERAAVDRGAGAGGNLYLKLDQLVELGVLDGGIRDIAHEIRIGGNEGAHATSVQRTADLRQQYTSEVLDFLRLVLEYMYSSDEYAALLQQFRNKWRR